MYFRKCSASHHQIAEAFIKITLNEINYISPCNEEEADIFIFLHIKHGSSVSQNKNVSIRIVDYDSVLVIDVALFYKKIGLDQRFGEFGTTTNYMILSLHKIAERLGFEHALTLFFTCI